MGIDLYDAVAYLGWLHAALLKIVGHESFTHADCTLGSVRVLETTVKALVPHTHVTVAIAWKLRERLRNLLSYLVSILRRSNEAVRRESRRKLPDALYVLEVRWHAVVRERLLSGCGLRVYR